MRRGPRAGRRCCWRGGRGAPRPGRGGGGGAGGGARRPGAGGARSAAAELGVEDELMAEWERSQPGLEERWTAAARSAAAKGWRWTGEMEEIAATFGAVGLPEGFHRAAAEVYRR